MASEGDVTGLTVEILKQIRDGVTAVADRVERTNAELAELRLETSAGFGDLGTRLERVEQGLNDLGTFMRGLAGDQARHERWLAQHVQRELDELKARLAKLEGRTAEG